MTYFKYQAKAIKELYEKSDETKYQIQKLYILSLQQEVEKPLWLLV